MGLLNNRANEYVVKRIKGMYSRPKKQCHFVKMSLRIFQILRGYFLGLRILIPLGNN